MNPEVEACFSALRPRRKARMNELQGLKVELLPGAIVDMHYRMPTYRVGDGRIAIASQKNFGSLCTCGYHHIEAFRANHPRIETGRGCNNLGASISGTETTCRSRI